MQVPNYKFIPDTIRGAACAVSCLMDGKNIEVILYSFYLPYGLSALKHSGSVRNDTDHANRTCVIHLVKGHT